MRLLNAVLVATLSVGTAYAQFGEAVVMGAEWDAYNYEAPYGLGAGILGTYCDTPPSRGIATVRFPNGGRLWDWEWIFTVKRPGHVVLASLAILSVDGSVRRIGSPLFFDYREVLRRNPAQTKAWPRGIQKLPVRLRPGDAVFFGITGWGEECPLDQYGQGCSVAEGHAALYVDEGTIIVPPEAR